MPSLTRTIFPTLLDKFERRLLAKLASDTQCSQSAVIRHLILKEVAQQRITLDRHEPPRDKALATRRAG